MHSIREVSAVLSVRIPLLKYSSNTSKSGRWQNVMPSNPSGNGERNDEKNNERRTFFWFEECSSQVRKGGKHVSWCPTKVLPHFLTQNNGTTVKLFENHYCVRRSARVICALRKGRKSKIRDINEKLHTGGYLP